MQVCCNSDYSLTDYSNQNNLYITHFNVIATGLKLQACYCASELHIISLVIMITYLFILAV